VTLSPRTGLRIEQIKWHARAAVCFQHTGDRGILSRPVGTKRGDLVPCECFDDGGTLQGDPLVDFARDTPVSGEIDKDRSSLRLQLVDLVDAEGQPANATIVFGRCGVEGLVRAGERNNGDGADEWQSRRS